MLLTVYTVLMKRSHCYCLCYERMCIKKSSHHSKRGQCFPNYLRPSEISFGFFYSGDQNISVAQNRFSLPSGAVLMDIYLIFKCFMPKNVVKHEISRH